MRLSIIGKSVVDDFVVTLLRVLDHTKWDRISRKDTVFFKNFPRLFMTMDMATLHDYVTVPTSYHIGCSVARLPSPGSMLIRIEVQYQELE